MLEVPRVAIADAPEGTMVRIVGRVLPGPTIAAPLSGRACVVHESWIGDDGWLRRRSDWPHETGGVPFTVDDGTGVARIDPGYAVTALAEDVRRHLGTFDAENAAERRFMKRHRYERPSFWVFLDEPITFREALVEVGDTVAIVAMGTREPVPGDGGGAAYRSGPATRLTLIGTRRFPMRLTDDPDGFA